MSWEYLYRFIGLVFLSGGIFFQLVGSIGILRLPDFFTRLHAMTKPDTLGVLLSTFGLALYHGWSLDSFKLLLGALFIFVASPAAAHALGRSAIRRGLKPWTKAGDSHES